MKLRKKPRCNILSDIFTANKNDNFQMKNRVSYNICLKHMSVIVITAILRQFQRVRGGSIYNGNTFITPRTNASELYTLYEKKEQVFTFRMVHKTLLYLNYLFNYRLLKKANSYTLNIFPSGMKRNILTQLGRHAVISKGN